MQELEAKQAVLEQDLAMYLLKVKKLIQRVKKLRADIDAMKERKS